MNYCISIIVPIYNSSKTLKRCIESLLNQTYKNIEIILVNDGSTDNSIDICKLYEEDNRIKIYNKNNGGVSSARNYGIKVANGKFVFFLDSDDTIDNDVIEKLISSYKEKNLIGVNIKIIEKEKSYILKYNNYYETNEFIDNILNEKINCYSCGYLFELEIVEKIMYDEKILFMEDTLFLLTYLQYVSSVNYEKSCYYNYYFVQNSLSNSNNIDNTIKNIINCDKVLNKLEKNINFTNISHNVHNLLINKKCRVFESEIGKYFNYNEISKIYDHNKIIEISNELKKECNKKYKIFFIIISKKYKILITIYLKTRKFLKKIKKMIG